jgi:hypothetical protein
MDALQRLRAHLFAGGQSGVQNGSQDIWLWFGGGRGRLYHALDHIAALVILPYIGVWSDRTRTPIGRRMPFILGGAPFAAIVFILIPLAPSLIPPQLNGQFSQMRATLAVLPERVGRLLATIQFRAETPG